MKKIDFNSKKILRIRIIVSSILLVLLVIGWIIYGVNLYRKDSKVVLNKFFKNEINIDLKLSQNGYINYNHGMNSFGLYHKDDNLYLYGNRKYVDLNELFSKYNMKLNIDEVLDKKNNRLLIDEIHKIIIDRYDYVENNNNYLEKSDVYEYNYTFNTSYLILSMSGNKNIMDTLCKMFGADEKTVLEFLDKYKDKRIEYRLYTKGNKRKIDHYNIRVEGLFSIYYRDGVYSGFIDDITYYKKDKDLMLLTEENDITLSRDDNVDINFDDYAKIDYSGLGILFY